MAEKHHITETPDTSHIKNIDVTHEVSDVYIGGIANFVAGLFVLIVVAFVLMWGMFRMLESRPVEGEKPRSPMARTDQERLPPEPRLQSAPGFAEELEKSAPKETAPKEKESGGNSKENTANAPVGKDPLWEIRLLRNQWDDVLTNGPTDPSGKRYGLPIEQAKQEVLKQLAAAKTEGRKP
jgi:hypothetical protein